MRYINLHLHYITLHPVKKSCTTPQILLWKMFGGSSLTWSVVWKKTSLVKPQNSSSSSISELVGLEFE